VTGAGDRRPLVLGVRDLQVLFDRADDAGHPAAARERR
jgi:hypothetical protein